MNSTRFSGKVSLKFSTRPCKKVVLKKNHPALLELSKLAEGKSPGERPRGFLLINIIRLLPIKPPPALGRFFTLRNSWLSRSINSVAASRPGVKDTAWLKRSSPFLLDPSPARLLPARAARKAKLAIKGIGFERHSTSMEEQYRDARLVTRHQLLANQTLLVNKLLQAGYLSWNEIENTGKGKSREVFEWWLIKPSLAAELLDQGELVVTGYGSRWWGRTTTGAPVYQDEVIGEIAASFYTDPDEDPTRKKVWC